jgi:hypothetical protein
MPIKTQRGTTVKPQKIPTTLWYFLLFALFGEFAFPKSRKSTGKIAGRRKPQRLFLLRHCHAAQ